LILFEEHVDVLVDAVMKVLIVTNLYTFISVGGTTGSEASDERRREQGCKATLKLFDGDLAM